MPKPIDFDHVEQMIRDNPGDWYSPEEGMARMDAMLKKSFNITGPRVSVRDVKTKGAEAGFVVDVDFDDIVKRGKDRG